MVDDLYAENLWYELGVVTVVALVVVTMALLAIRWLEVWLVPW